jgi:hypothetical protein
VFERVEEGPLQRPCKVSNSTQTQPKPNLKSSPQHVPHPSPWPHKTEKKVIFHEVKYPNWPSMSLGATWFHLDYAFVYLSAPQFPFVPTEVDQSIIDRLPMIEHLFIIFIICASF